jgi:putative ABC transport system permease protein
MFALLISALRERAAQAATVLVLTTLAVAAAVAGPWYLETAAQKAAAVDVAAAPPTQHIVSVRKIDSTSGNPQRALETFATAVRRDLTLPEQRPVLGMNSGVTIDGVDYVFAYRDEICEHVRLTGDCPSAPDQVIVSAKTASVLGDTVKLGTRRFQIVGRYEQLDPGSDYWGDPLFDGNSIYAAKEAFAAAPLQDPAMTYDTPVPDGLLRGDGGYDLAADLHHMDYQLGRVNLSLVAPVYDLLDAIAADRSRLRDGVVIGTAQVIGLSWFALAVAGAYTARGRRNDVALLKLRGSTRLGIARLTLGQQAVPVLAGLVLGAVLGYLAGRRSLAVPELPSALAESGVFTAVTVGGILVVLVVAELAALRAPVAALLRGVPAKRRNWTTSVLDLVLVVVAIAGVYQARTGGAGSLFARLAPALVAVAMAVLLARLLVRVADRSGGAGLRTGRLGPALTALQLSRRPGTDRVFALTVVAVAVLGTAAAGWAGGSDADAGEAARQLGAPRVLTVEADNLAALRTAVHAADPGGHHAMAVVVNRLARPPIIAVETDRFASIALPEVGTLPAVATATGDPLATVTGARLRLDVRKNGDDAVNVSAHLENRRTGATVTVGFSTVQKGQSTVDGPVDGCPPPDGCRLVSLDATGPVVIAGLAQEGPDQSLLDGGRLGDPKHWRGESGGAPIITRDGALSITGAARALVVDGPLPLPAVLAGTPPTEWVTADPTLLATSAGRLPLRVTARVGMLPAIGDDGVLVDLGSAERVADDLGGTYQVWLSADADGALIGRLGLRVLDDTTLDEARDRLTARGSAAASRYGLATAVVVLLSAAAALGVAAAVERGPRAVELVNLRRQGLTAPAARRIGYGAPSTVVLLGVLCGLLVAVLARLATGVGDAHTPATAVTGVVALVVLGLAAWVSAAPLVRAVGR